MKTYDGQALWIYRNGELDDVIPFAQPSPLVADPSRFVLGHDVLVPLTGGVDELRVSRLYVDADWVLAQYLSMTQHFVTIR